MAKRATFTFQPNKQKKRKGVHAKSKTTTNKGATNYKKPYKGQGR
tara:strand:+ start:640 stop:774 length:135 start_codon:yes stop_codon:yes gene_type:complete